MVEANQNVTVTTHPPTPPTTTTRTPSPPTIHHHHTRRNKTCESMGNQLSTKPNPIKQTNKPNHICSSQKCPWKGKAKGQSCCE